MRKYFLALLFSLSAFGSFADLVRVGLFSGSVFTAAEFVVADGNYSERLPNGRKENLSTGSTLTFTVSGTGCSVKKNGKPLGKRQEFGWITVHHFHEIGLPPTEHAIKGADQQSQRSNPQAPAQDLPAEPLVSISKGSP